MWMAMPKAPSTFRWLRNGATIAGATASTYTLVAADGGASITFEVTPVAATGAGATIGTPVLSAIAAGIDVIIIPTLSYALLLLLMILLGVIGIRQMRL